MGEGKAGICGDGTIERLDRAGVHGQLRLIGLYVGVPRGERRRGQGESVSVRQHDGLIRYSTRNDTISLDARERGLLARKGLVCDLADWGWPLLPTRLPRCAQPGGGSPCSQVYFSGPSPVVEVLQNRVNPPIRLCGDPPACGHSLPAVARARADGHTCRTPLVRARWPSPALPLLPRSGRSGRAP